MKKLLLFAFVFTLFACSSGDDNNNSTTLNPDLVGAWEATIIDGSSSAEQVFTLNSDGTGSVFNLWDDGETYFAEFTWYSNSTTIYTTYLENNETDSGDYELSNNNNTCVITVNSTGAVYVYTRI